MVECKCGGDDQATRKRELDMSERTVAAEIRAIMDREGYAGFFGEALRVLADDFQVLRADATATRDQRNMLSSLVGHCMDASEVARKIDEID